jgi:hypothetical protein
MTPDTDTGPRSTITDHQPNRPGNGSSRTWSRVLRGVPHRFTAVTMPDGERRYFADRYNGYGDDGTDRGRESGMRFGCAWSRVASWIIPPSPVPAIDVSPALAKLEQLRTALAALEGEARTRHASEVTFARVELRGVVTDHSDAPSPCCGAGEHRPGGGPWFCRDCGNTRPDTPPARQR